MRFLSLIISIQLLLSTFPNTAFALTADELKEKKRECAEKDRVFDENLNDCILDKETTEIKGKAQECAELPPEEQRACREELAEEIAQKKLDDEDLNPEENEFNPFDTAINDELDFKTSKAAMYIMTGALTYYLIKRKFKSTEKCPSMSLKIMLGAGIALATTEVIADTVRNNNYNEIHDEYQKDSELDCTTQGSVEQKIEQEIINAAVAQNPSLVKDVEVSSLLPGQIVPSNTNAGDIADFDQNNSNTQPNNITTRTKKVPPSIEEAKAELGSEKVNEITQRITDEFANREENATCEQVGKKFSELDDSEIGKTNSLLTKSFKLLEKKERVDQKVANIKAGGYTLAGAAYLTALGFAIKEVATTPGELCPDPTKVKSKKPTAMLQENDLNDALTKLKVSMASFQLNEIAKNTGYHYAFEDASVEEIQEITIRNIIKTAGKDIVNFIAPKARALKRETGAGLYTKRATHSGLSLLASFSTVMLYMGAGVAMEAVQDSYSLILETSFGRIAASTLLATNTGFIAYYAFDEAELAEKRANAIKELQTKFNLTGGAGFNPCPTRDDSSKPACFCYLESGEKNLRRSRQAACLSEFNEKGPLKPTDYRIIAKRSKGPKTCITNQGKLDDKCACRSAKREKDKCSSVGTDFNFEGAIDSTFTKGAIQQVNAISNGVLSPVDVEVGKNLNNAAKLSRRIKAIKKKSPIFKKNKNKFAKFNAKFNKVNKILAKKFEKVAASIPQTKTNISDIKSPKDALKALKKDLRRSSVKYAGVKKQDNTNTNSNSLDDFDFDLGNEASPGVSVEDLDAAMDKEYEFKGDINNNPDNNLFDILTLRYQRSALRRLFDDEGKMQADKALESDINEK